MCLKKECIWNKKADKKGFGLLIVIVAILSPMRVMGCGNYQVQ
jgi:hypothetical protein